MLHKTKTFRTLIVLAAFIVTACATPHQPAEHADTPIEDVEPAAPAPALGVDALTLLLAPPKVELKRSFYPVPHATGVVVFDKVVTSESADALIAAIESAQGMMESLIIEIDSPGGSVMAGRRIIRAIEDSSVNIYCIVEGEGDSMAMAILQACPFRAMSQRSRLMAHEPAVSGAGGNSGDLANDSKSLQTLSKALAEGICHRMKISRAACMYKFSDGREWWLDWEEAKAVGAVDKVYPRARDMLNELMVRGRID